MRECVCPSNRFGYGTRVIDDLVYLYGSTCADEVGLTMTLAHKLQHAIQHGKERNVWAVNSEDEMAESVKAMEPARTRTVKEGAFPTIRPHARLTIYEIASPESC